MFVSLSLPISPGQGSKHTCYLRLSGAHHPRFPAPVASPALLYTKLHLAFSSFLFSIAWVVICFCLYFSVMSLLDSLA
ncbi:hypothetical protein BDV10DRAFT_64604 [Aspergillus recurvatus]